MKKLLRFLKDYRRDSILSPLFKMLEALLELLVPLIMASIIDRGIGQGDTGYIVRMCLLLAALAVAGLACSVSAQFFAARASAGFAARVRHALFAHIQTLSYSDIDRMGTSAMITRMTSDVNQLQTGVNLTLRLLLRSPFIVFGSMIMAFTISVRSALIFAGAIPVLSVVIFAIMLWCIPRYKQAQEKLDGLLRRTRESLSGVRVIRAFCREDKMVEDFDGQNESLTRTQLHVGRVSVLLNPLTYVIVNLAILLLIHSGAIQVNAGTLSQGQVVALYNYMAQILVELIKLANLIINITKSVACGNRIEAVLETGGEMTSPRKMPQTGGDPAVAFHHVRLRYGRSGADSLTDIDFSVKPGQTVGIIGGTGCGKTSLVNLIPRFYDVSEGSVEVDGADVREYPLNALRRKIGVVPQNAVLFHGTIRENLRWGKKDATDDEIYDALQTAQAKSVALEKGGLDYVLEQDGANLSGGQKQRFTIARALVGKPEILILDDSASALDFATDAALRQALRALTPRPTVFVVSQRVSSIQHADLIVVLDDGVVAGMGTHESLLASCQVYAEIYASQTRGEGAL
ncbi:MAG: ABC transporter ATP-binding protein [Faecousia sp.]